MNKIHYMSIIWFRINLYNNRAFSLKFMKRPSWSPYIAELIGTATLTFGVLAGIHGSLPVATPVVAGLILCMFVYTIGGISGSHINPAVTIGLWSVKKISTLEASKYVLAQLLGAVIARQIFGIGAGFPPNLPVAGDTIVVLGFEALGAFFLLFGIMAVVAGKVHEAASGIVIGGSLLLGILVAANFSYGILNPAVAVGVGSFSVFYIVGPIVGGAAATHLYRFLVEGK